MNIFVIIFGIVSVFIGIIGLHRYMRDGYEANSSALPINLVIVVMGFIVVFNAEYIASVMVP